MATQTITINDTTYTVSRAGAAMLAGFGPGSNPDAVIAAFEMVGMGDEARYWASLHRRWEGASAKVAPPAGNTLFDVTMDMGAESPENARLRAEADDLRTQTNAAWWPLEAVIESIKLVSDDRMGALG